MSAYLNRAVSMVTEKNGMATSSSSSSFDTDSISENRTFANDKSPLQVFVKAKKRINDIYDEINEYVMETFHFLDGELFRISDNNKYYEHNFRFAKGH